MATTARALRLLVAPRPSAAAHRNLLQAPLLHRRHLSAASTESAGAGDPEVHSSDDPPSVEYTERPAHFSGAEKATTKKNQHQQSSTPPPSSSEPTAKERVPPFGQSGKLGTQELADPAAGSTFTQKRRLSSSSPAGRDAREEATPGKEESEARKVREEDREYYRTHKPSPLAEVEFADTRKPVTQATDGGAADRFADVGRGCTVEDTADDSLARAEALFREARERGIPELPHSRALAQMLARRKEESSGGKDAPWGS